MERNRDLRIETASAVNGLSRRRQRVTSLKDSTEEDREMGLHEAVRLTDRERSQKKDRDREFPKRRRIEKYAMQQKNCGEGYRENESTDVSDEEYLEEVEDARIHFLNRLDHPPLQSSSHPNSRRNLRTLRSSPVLRASVDETIGVPIPRRARSTSIKRLHDYRNLSSGKLGEELGHRRFPSSTATASHIFAGGASPSASGASMRKKMKSVEPRARALKSTSNPRPSSEIQDDIEIEVVEALFDLMKQSQSLSQSSKNEEKIDKDSVNAADEGLTKGGKEENRKSIKVDPETAMDDSMGEMKKDKGIEREKFPNDSAPQHGDGFLDIEQVLSPKESESLKVYAYEVQDSKVTRADDTAIVVEDIKKEAKLWIDLMVPPQVTSSPEKDVLGDMAVFPKYMAHDVQKNATISNDAPGEAIKHLPTLDLEKHYHNKSSVSDGGKQQLPGQEEQKNHPETSLSPFQISLGGWPSVLPHPGYMRSQQAVLPVDDGARFPNAMQPPKFTFSQPRPKRSATHQYIGSSIQHHQQLITNSLLSGPTGVATLCGTMPPTQRLINGSPAIGECQGKHYLGAITVGNGKHKGSEVPLTLNSTKNKDLMLQQASLHTTANNFLHNPAFLFPLGHHQTAVMASAKSSGPAQSASASGNMSLRSNSAGGPSVNLSLPGEEAVTSLKSPSLASNEVAPYMAGLQNNGCHFPISTSMAMPQLKGVQSPPLPLFNSPLYSSTMFSVSQSQKLSNTKIVDNNYCSIAAAHSTQTEKLQFPPPHPSSNSAPEIGKKGSALYADALQRSTENRDEHILQPLSASFGLNAPSCLPLNFSSMAQNSAILPVLQDMAWNGYQMAKQKNFQISDGESVIGCTIDDGLKRSLGKPETHGRKSSSNDVSPVSMMVTSIVDGLAGSVNFVPSVASGNQQSFPPPLVSQTSGVLPILHQHQQQSIQLQKHYMQQMQQAGTAKINVSAGNVLPGSFLPGSFPIQNPFFSKVSVQTDNSSYSHHWQNLPRSAAPEAISQTAHLSVANIPQPKSSFGSHSVSAASPQGQQLVANKQPVLPVGSTSDSSISKYTGGSERMASNVVNADAAISALPSQHIDASPNGPSQKSPPACRGNVLSVLNPCPGQLSELKY